MTQIRVVITIASWHANLKLVEIKQLDLTEIRNQRAQIVLSGSTPEVVDIAIDVAFETMRTEIGNGLKVASNLDYLLRENYVPDWKEAIDAERALLEKTLAKILKIASRVYRPILRSGGVVGLDKLLSQATGDLYGTREIFAKYDLPITSRAEAARMNMCAYYSPEEIEAFFNSDLYQSFFVDHKRFVIIAFATHPLKAVDHLKFVKDTYYTLIKDPAYKGLVSRNDMIKLVFRDSEPATYLKEMMEFFSNFEGEEKNIFQQAPRLFISHYINGSREKISVLIADVREVIMAVPPEMSRYVSPFLICDQVVSRHLTPDQTLKKLAETSSKAFEQASLLEDLLGGNSLKAVVEVLVRANCMDRNFLFSAFRRELEEAIRIHHISPLTAFHMLSGKYLSHRNP